MRLARSLIAAVALAGAVAVLTATAAVAHPFITDDATVPASSLTPMTLEMGHGCGNETEGGGDPTLEVAMEVPDAVSFIEPLDTDGYEASVETGSDGRPEVVVWTATDGGVEAPAVPMDIVIDGAEGDELLLKVFQGCEGFQYRWIGTPDEPADDPAVAVTLGPADPDAPPPPEDEPSPTDGEVEEPTEEAPGPAATAGGGQDDTASTDDQTEAPDAEETAAATTTEEGDPPPWVGIGLVALLILTALFEARRRQRNLRATSEPGK